MKKNWKYRACCVAAALLMAGAGPSAALADGQAADAGTQQTAEQQAAALAAWEAQLDSYFDGSVMIGDSVMLGFRNYAMRRPDTWLGRVQFLAAGSFSVHNALQPVMEKSVHPVYQGEKRLIWDSLQMMGARRIFLFFGLNDMNMGPLENTYEKYKQVIAKIKAACPDAEIHLISMTYTLRGKGKGNLRNDVIRQYNAMLRQMALENGWGYVELADRLADENGDLAAAYCSDNYVHQTNAAYDVWATVFREYAASQITGTSAFPAFRGNEEGEQGQAEGQEQAGDGGSARTGQETEKASGPADEVTDKGE